MAQGRAMAKIDEVNLDISIVLGKTHMPIHQVLRLSRGAVIELDAMEGDSVEILANDLPIAEGTVIVEGSDITVSITRLIRRPEVEGAAGPTK